jgi:hypothetical protein
VGSGSFNSGALRNVNLSLTSVPSIMDLKAMKGRKLNALDAVTLGLDSNP